MGWFILKPMRRTYATKKQGGLCLGRFIGICRMLAAFAAASSAVQGAEIDHWLAKRLNPRVSLIEDRLDEIGRLMKKLPVLTDMDALGSHGFHSNFTFDSESNWFEISWSEPQTIDGIAVVPTRLTTQSGDMSNYGFPNRLLVEAMIPGAMEPVEIAELADSRLDFRQGEPAFISIPAMEVTSIRFIPVDLPFLPGKQVRFFSLSEVMVFQGERNLAPDGKLSANYSIDAEAGWNIR